MPPRRPAFNRLPVSTLVEDLREAADDIADDLDGIASHEKNGELIACLEAAGYAVLVTNDKNMAFEQPMRNRFLAVVALPSNRRNTILGRVEDIADSIRRVVPGCHLVMDRNGTRALRRYDGHAWIVDPLPTLRLFFDRPG